MNGTTENRYSLMTNIMLSFVKPCLIGCAVKYDIVDHLSKKEMNCNELALVTNTKEDNLQRLLTGLKEIGVLKLNENGKYSVTKLGETLKENDPHSLKNYVKLLYPGLFMSVCNIPQSIENGDTPFELLFGKPFYSLLKDDTELQDTFYGSMRELTIISYNYISPVYDFAQFRKIVDIGGGDGSLMRCILSHNINTTGIVFDQPLIIKKIERSLKEQFGDRCDAIAGDFFDSVPSGGDCYIIKQVLFNFNDENVLKLLKNVAKQMNSGSKLVIIEPMFGRQFAIEYDSIMLTMFGGKVRTVTDYENLLTNAGLKLNRKITIPQYISDIIEAVLI